MSSTVLSLRPFMVTMDVSVKFPLISMQVLLCFGPFNSREKAERWAGAVEHLHRGIEMKEFATAGEVFDSLGVPTSSFIRSYVHDTDIIQVDQDARRPGSLIPVQSSEIDARDLHIYALKALEEAIAMAFAVIEHEKTKK